MKSTNNEMKSTNNEMKSTNDEDLYPGTEPAETPKAPEGPSPEEIEIRFQKLKDASGDGYRLDEKPDGTVEFVLVCKDKLEVVDVAERFALVHTMRPMMANAFREGMVDGIKQYRKLIAQKNASLFSKALEIGDKMITWIERQPKASANT